MELADKIISAFSANTNPERASKMKAYMKNRFEFYGLQAGIRKELQTPIIRSSTKLAIDEVLKEAYKLWQVDARECQYAAVDLMIRHKKKLRPQDLPMIERMTIEKSWWDTVDFLASHMTGAIFLKYPDQIEVYLPKWLKSDNIWLNRICLLFQLKYRDKTDFDLLTHAIHSVNHKNEFFIQKAIGWSLRQYSKFNPKAVGAFINATELSNLAVKEGSKYLK